MLTVMVVLGPSHPAAVVWLTYQVVVPGVVVGGTGAVVLPVPPLAVVYHSNEVPEAVNAVAVAPSQ